PGKRTYLETRLLSRTLAEDIKLADGSTLTVGELAESINRSPSATSRLVDGLVKRRLVERKAEEEDRRQKTLRLTPRGHAVLRVVDRGRAEQFLSAVRPMPTAERAIVAMGVAALATHAISRRCRLIRAVRDD
ncbi:MAG: MarR family winged helix-turn-helix transcriptional regulator, partial [Candidatus Limnocylindrales bacterium]